MKIIDDYDFNSNSTLGNIFPVPINICPTPKSRIDSIKRMKHMFFSRHSSTDKNEQPNGNRDDQLGELNIRNRNHQASAISAYQDNFKNKATFDGPRSCVINEKLTYKMVIERIVRRFLLQYKNKCTGMNEENDSPELKELKKDVSSFRFELLNEVDRLDDTLLPIKESIEKFSSDLRGHFDLEEIKLHLDKQKG